MQQVLSMQFFEEGKVMVEALEGWEIPKQLGWQEGWSEGWSEGRQEVRQEIAERMLRDGVNQDFICKYTQMSAKEIEELENGNKDSN